tara:strand:- start:123 stop:272 length:150 start_codon:yes stop_codon:yes gene_type:complete
MQLLNKRKGVRKGGGANIQLARHHALKSASFITVKKATTLLIANKERKP